MPSGPRRYFRRRQYSSGMSRAILRAPLAPPYTGSSTVSTLPPPQFFFSSSSMAAPSPTIWLPPPPRRMFSMHVVEAVDPVGDREGLGADHHRVQHLPCGLDDGLLVLDAGLGDDLLRALRGRL